MKNDILYSFRRCPYAIRARWALLICEIKVEIREIDLKNKPLDFLNNSKTKTVPILIKKNSQTHFLELKNENTMIAKKIKVIPLEIVLRNIAYGSLCRQTTIKSGTVLAKPLIDIYLKNDELNDPLITKDRIELMNILSSHDLELIINLTLKIIIILKSFFKNIQLQLVDFKLEFGYDFRNNIILGDEISPDNCRLWDLNQKNDTIVSLDKDRFRNDLGGLIEAYSEIHRRINDFL